MSDDIGRDDATLLELRGITKQFGDLKANEDVDFSLRRGEIHALVGENGAGKTTLMKVLYGMYHPDAGHILVDGSRQDFRKPQDAIDHGIGMVHQHFMLVPSFTVAENITLGAEPGTPGVFSRVEAEKAIRAPMDHLGVRIDPSAVTGTLSVATQQKIEIIKVLYRGAKVLILDEPTAVLTPQETQELFGLLRRLTDEGSSVVFISHKLREVFAIADRITVLRSGRSIETFDTAATDTPAVVAAMTGRGDVHLGRVERGAGEVAEPIFEMRDVTSTKPSHDAALDTVSLTVRPGEIVGIAGVEGNGQSALAEAIIGTLAVDSGRIDLGGEDLKGLPVSRRRDAGLGYVAEDRHREGLPINGTVLEGLAAGEVRSRRGLGSLGRALGPRTRKMAQQLIDEYAVKTSGTGVACHTLSGGNQQKLVLARELTERPSFLVLSQPTRGVDLGAIEFLYSRIAEATRLGCGVLLISADLDEIFRLSDRVLVMFRGRIVSDERTEDTSREELGMHMMTGERAGASS